MSIFKNQTRLKKISIVLGIVKGIISLILISSPGDFKQYDKDKYGRKF